MEQKFLRAILELIVNCEAITPEQIALVLRARGEVFTDDELDLAFDVLHRNGYITPQGLQ
jgi:hypothetical protein